MNFFTDRLKTLRKEKKLTQKELAEQIGIKQNSYSDWETGKNEPSLENIVKLTKIFKCSVKIRAAKLIASSGEIEPSVHTSSVNLS
mgnify:CR=1 FL=1